MAKQATGGNAKALRQQRLAGLTGGNGNGEHPVNETDTLVDETEDFDTDELLDELNAAAAGASDETRKAAVKAGKTPRQPREPKAVVNRLEHVIEQQASPTMWQYARLAKAVKQRIDAGQGYDEALDGVIQQTLKIIVGILEQNPQTANDGDIDNATRTFFQSYAPKSLRERGSGKTNG